MRDLLEGLAKRVGRMSERREGKTFSRHEGSCLLIAALIASVW